MSESDQRPISAPSIAASTPIANLGTGVTSFLSSSTGSNGSNRVASMHSRSSSRALSASASRRGSVMPGSSFLGSGNHSEFSTVSNSSTTPSSSSFLTQPLRKKPRSESASTAAIINNHEPSFASSNKSSGKNMWR